MACTICKNVFIITTSLRDYVSKKKIFDETVSKELDELTDEEFESKSQAIWETILIHDVMLLQPNKIPKKCAYDLCSLLICDSCFIHNKYCNGCKSREPSA
jgi:hypothetical protein